MILPTALAIGPMKTGTSWLQDYLAARADVCLPREVKETFFFDRHYARSPVWYQRRFRHFDPARHLIRMEVGPSYFHSPDAPGRIRQTLGSIPLLVILRDPAERAWSHYLHLKRKGYTRLPLQEAVIRFPEILDASRYEMQLRRWRDTFEEETIHVFQQHDLARSPEAFAQRICTVLRLPFDNLPQGASSRSNEASLPPSPLLASLATSVGNVLRASGAYGVVNLAKRFGLKQAVYGRDGEARPPRLSDEDRAWINHRLG